MRFLRLVSLRILVFTALLVGMGQSIRVWADAPASTTATGFTINFASSRLPDGVDVNSNSVWNAGGFLAFFDSDSLLTITFSIPDGTDTSNWIIQPEDRAFNENALTTAAGGGVSPVFILNSQSVPTSYIQWPVFDKWSYKIGKFLKTGANVLIVTCSSNWNVQYQLKSLYIGPPK